MELYKVKAKKRKFKGGIREKMTAKLIFLSNKMMIIFRLSNKQKMSMNLKK